MKRWLKICLFCTSTLVLISWDRATKDLAKEHLKDKAAVSYLHDFVRLQYAENTGAALNLGDSLSRTASFWLLSLLPLVVLLIVFMYVLKKSNEMSFLKMFSFALIFAGGLGNIIDRIVFDRHVTDFMIIGFKSIRTGIFNFADVCVTVGAILLIWLYREKQLKPVT